MYANLVLETYQVALKGAIVDLANKYLDTEAHSNKTSKNQRSSQCERNLQGLSCKSFDGRVDLDCFSGHWVDDLVLVLELRSFLLDLRYAPDTPLYSKVDFLLLPILDEYHTPQRVYCSVDW